MNSKFDKYERIEEFIKQDLDHWMCNLYFQVERMQISDIKTDSQTGELYYAPLSSTALYRPKTALSRASRLPPLKGTIESLHSEQADSAHQIAIHDDPPPPNHPDTLLVDDQAYVGVGRFISKEDKLKNMDVFADSQSESSAHSKSVFKDKREADFEKDLDLYKFSVNEKLNLSTRQLTLKKVRYILDEVLQDVKLKNLKTVEFQLWVFYVLCLLYLRMFSHYIGQFIILQMMGVPVTQFEAHWYKIYITYAEWEFY